MRDLSKTESYMLGYPRVGRVATVEEYDLSLAGWDWWLSDDGEAEGEPTRVVRYECIKRLVRVRGGVACVVVRWLRESGETGSMVRAHYGTLREFYSRFEVEIHKLEPELTVMHFRAVLGKSGPGK